MSSADRPWEKVTDPSYFRAVLRNFVAMGYGLAKDGRAKVRFGVTGGGVHPNYQIETDDARLQCFRGSSHKEASDLAASFDPDNISDAFAYSDVTEMLQRIT